MGTLGLTDSQNYADIAEAIRLKSGTSSVYLPSEMALAIRQISGGGAVILQNKTATPSTATQTITADAGYDGLGNVTIDRIPTDYLIPTGIKQITENGIYDVAAFKSANVAVPTGGGAPTIAALTIVPNDNEQSFSAAMSGVDGFSPVMVAAISGDYIGNDIPRITSNTQFTVNNNSITVPSGYYENALSKSIGTTKAAATITPGTTNQVINSGTYLTGNQTILGDSDLVPGNIRKDIQIFNVTGTYEAGSVEPVLQEKTASSSTAKQTITADAGYDGLSKVTINAITTGTATTPAKTINVTPSISVNSANGQISVSVSGSSAITPTVSAGYVSQGTSGTVSVSGSSSYSLTTKAATTYTPGTASQTIAANQFLTGAQTIKGDANLVAANIKKNVAIFGVTGAYEGSGGTPNLQDKSIDNPGETATTVSADAGYDGLQSVTVGAISSSFVGSNVARKSSADLTASNSTITAPAGYYASNATKTISTGSATTPAKTISVTPTISVSNAGVISVSVSGSSSITPTVSAGYISAGTAGTVSVSGSSSQSLTTQAAATITPSESQQTAVASGKYTTGDVKVAAISSTYVGSGVAKKSSADLTASNSTVTAPAGYYASAATKTVSAGTAGTPTAAKGTVSNHSISVTPSVTNTTGWITGSTKTGTAVTVSASELVSGTYTFTNSGTVDVTNYASAKVSAGTAGTPTATKGTVNNHSVSITPSVTNTTGWITGSTKTGTAVTVNASELVSGSSAISSNGTYDVTNYASAVVSIDYVTYYTGRDAPPSSLGQDGDIYLQL